MKNIILKMLLLVIALLCVKSVQAQQPLKIGDEFSVDLKMTKTYQKFKKTAQQSADNKPQLVFKKEFYSKNSSYIKLYFENFDLAPGDYVQITGMTSKERIIYGGKGKIVDSQMTMISDFWSQVLFDDKVEVTLYSFGKAKNHNGFEITKVAYGYSEERIMKELNATSAQNKSICASDNKEQIICYQGTEMFEKAKAVCRLLVGGTSLCTGWLLGSEGHLMTNNHCIGSASSAQNTDFMFNYQNQNCSGSSPASSDVVASSSSLIKTNSGLDYTLVKLPVNPTNTYGYLSLSPVVASPGDRIYIPQHPGGRRKEISVRTDSDPTPGGFSRVYQSTLSGGRQLTYYADTEGGSSGSPVIDYNSNLVVAIHNTGGCPNGSNGRSDSLISAIGGDMPNNGVGGQTNQGKVTLYQHCNYGGYTVGLSEGNYTLSQLQSLGARDNDISSLKVQSGYEITIYENNNFNGRSYTFSGDDACLVNENFNDIVTSVQVRSVNKATVYQDCNYGGYAVGLPAGNYTLNQLQARGIRDNDISSLRVESGYEIVIYENDNFSGRSYTFSSDDTCLVNESFNDIVTSIRLRPRSTNSFSTLLQAEDYTAMSGIQTEPTTDTGGGLNVGWTDTGDWLSYSGISFPSSGSYLLEYRVASTSNTSSISSDLNAGATILGSLSIPNTGGWQNWQTVSQIVNIPSGTHDFGIFIQSTGVNINWIRITKTEDITVEESMDEQIATDPDQPVEIDKYSELKVYPNPTENVLYFNTNLSNARLTIVDAQSGLIARKKVVNNGVDVSDLPSGLYTIIIEKDGKKMIKRFVKK